MWDNAKTKFKIFNMGSNEGEEGNKQARLKYQEK